MTWVTSALVYHCAALSPSRLRRCIVVAFCSNPGYVERTMVCPLHQLSLVLVLTGFLVASNLAVVYGADSIPHTTAVLGLPDSPDGLIGGSAVVIAPGLALTLQEGFAKPVSPGERLVLALPGGLRRMATVQAIDASSTGVLLACDTSGITPLALADASVVAIGSTVWTLGNSSGAVVDDGAAALSRGVLSGRYDLPMDGPSMRGRGGRILSTLSGSVYEIDAAVNDGDQGAAVLDANGRLIGLASLATARERRLGTVVPVTRLLPLLIAAGLDLPLVAGASDDTVPATPAGLAVVTFDRFKGLGNPEAVPRPPKTLDQVPVYERDRLERWWDRYHHEQQVLWTDSPVPALVIDPARGYLLTAAAHLHGGATSGRVMLPNGASVPFSLLAVDIPLDLAVLVASEPLPLSGATIAATGPMPGDALAVVARHRLDAPPTRTVGHVSCTQRRLEQSGIGFLQIDARTNYASLGGAVIDRSGTIIGMVVKSGPEAPWLINSGVTLVVDGVTIAGALPGLLAGTTRQRLPTLGLGIMLSSETDALILSRVTPGTGAAAVGLREGDILLAVDGRTVTSQQAVSRVLLRHRPKDTVPVEIRRHGKNQTLSVVLQEFGG